MNRGQIGSLAAIVMLLSGCFPAKTWYGFSYHETSMAGEYNCRFVELKSTFGGEDFYEGSFDAESPVSGGHQILYIPGFIHTGMVLEVALDCFDEHEQHQGTTVYRVALIDARSTALMSISNYLPADLDPGDCMEPTSHTGELFFCATIVMGFRPADP